MKGDSAQESKYSFKLQRKKGRNELDLEPCPKQSSKRTIQLSLVIMHFLTAWGMMRGFFSPTSFWAAFWPRFRDDCSLKQGGPEMFHFQRSLCIIACFQMGKSQPPSTPEGALAGKAGPKKALF